MKFLIAVLIIHLIVELIGKKRKNNKDNSTVTDDENIRHPAEYELR